MGWDFCQTQTTKEMKAELRASTASAGYIQLAEKTVGKVWYRVLQSPAGDKFIAVYLTERSKRHGVGYKSMDEDMGPCAVDCPVEFLTLAIRQPECQSHYSKEWRKRVLLHALLTPQAPGVWQAAANANGLSGLESV